MKNQLITTHCSFPLELSFNVVNGEKLHQAQEQGPDESLRSQHAKATRGSLCVGGRQPAPHLGAA